MLLVEIPGIYYQLYKIIDCLDYGTDRKYLTKIILNSSIVFKIQFFNYELKYLFYMSLLVRLLNQISFELITIAKLIVWALKKVNALAAVG